MSLRFALSQKRLVWIAAALVPILIAALALISFHPGHASAADLSSNYTWKPLKIGGGGWVTGLVIHPKTSGVMYGRTDVGGAYRWDPNTQTWSQMILGTNVPNVNATDYNVESIAISPSNDQVVYMAVGGTYLSPFDNGRILKSTDRGQTWSDSGKRWYIQGNGDYRQGAERLAVDPNNDSVVYYGSRTEGLWVSTDGASTWNQISTSTIPVGSNSSGTAAGVKFVLFDPNSGTTNGKTNRIYVGVTGQGVYRSDDAGATWNQILSNNQIPFDVALGPDQLLYVAFQNTSGNGSVQKYNPSSGSWSDISPSSESCYNLAVDPFNGQRIFVSACGMRNGHLWRTTNGGTNWDTLNVAITSKDIPWILNTDTTSWLSVGRLVFDPFVQGRLWFSEGFGVYQSNNLTDATTITWDFTSDGIEEMVGQDVIAPPGGKPIGVAQDHIGFYHDNPDAYPQQPIITPNFNDGTSLDYSGGTPSFIVAESSDSRTITTTHSAYSTDYGKTWTEFSGMHNYADLYGGDIAVSATNTNTIIWLPTNGKPPYISTDRGATWTKISTLASTGGLHTMIWWASKKALESDKVNGEFYLYSTENGGEFYRSTGGGSSWTKTASAPSSSNDSHVYGQVRAVPGHAGHVWMSNAQGGLSYSIDAGDTWTKVSAFQEAHSFGFGATIGSATYPTIFVDGKVNNEWGVWRSTDQGANWDLVSQYPLNLADQINTINGDMNIPGRVYVGFGGNGFAYGNSNESGGSTPTPTTAPTATPTPTSTPQAGGSLPSPWQDGDIGSVGAAGSASYNNGTFTLNGSGNDIWGTSDGFNFAYQSLNGDGTIVARVASLQNTDPWAKAGVMIRNTLDAGSPHAFMAITPGNGAAFQYRASSGGDSSNTNTGSWTAPTWVKLVRSGNTFTGSVSSDGSSWTQIGSTTISMGSSAYIGLAVTSHSYSTLAPATFDNVNVTSGGSASTTLTPTADRDNWAQHTGTETLLDVSIYQYSYLKFDMSPLGTINSAHLRLYRPDVNESSITLTAYQVSSSAWNEADNSTLPAPGDQITTSATSSSVGYIDLDITSYVQAARANGKWELSIAVNASCSQWESLNSRENSSNRPQLVVN